MAEVVLAAYLIGSIPFALLLARRSGADLRLVGSGNMATVFPNLSRFPGSYAGGYLGFMG